MDFNIAHPIPERLASLSGRLRNTARRPASARNLALDIKAKSLPLNVPFVLSRLLLELKLQEWSKATFAQLMDEYNTTNNTQVTFQALTDLHWIRHVAGKVLLPYVVEKAVWRATRDDNPITPLLPPEYRPLFNFLETYYLKYYRNAVPTISEGDLERSLNEASHGAVTPHFLVEKGIFQEQSPGLFAWMRGNDYATHLHNDIAATLWLLLATPKPTPEQFAEYVQILLYTDIWPNDLSNYLPPGDLMAIGQLAIEYLDGESDLLRRDDEFSKIRLDSASDFITELIDPNPSIKFNYASPFDFMISMENQNGVFMGVFEYQRARVPYRLLLRLIISGDAARKVPYERTLTLLKDTSRPMLIWMACDEIGNSFPYVIPHLLTNTDLAPMAFMLIDELMVNDGLLAEQSSRERKAEERNELVNAFAQEMFEILLFQLPAADNTDAAQVLTRIFRDLTRKTFMPIINNTSEQLAQHQAHRKRYDRMLKMLWNKREGRIHVYPPPKFNHRYSMIVAPQLIDRLEPTFDDKPTSFNDFARFNVGLFDLGIEFLRIAHSALNEPGIPELHQGKIKDACRLMSLRLVKEFILFFTMQEIDVVNYAKNESTKQRPKWGIPEFGFEIIDWGYFYLHLDLHEQASGLEQAFSHAIQFKTDGTRYDQENKDQSEKITLFLRSQLLAYVSIQEHKVKYELDCLPVSSTLKRLGQSILAYAAKHSAHRPGDSRTDVFDERYSYGRYNIYHQPLSPLLYKALNYFPEAEQEHFIADFFEGCTDLNRMLRAVNALHTKKLKQLISRCIASVNITNFIEDHVNLEDSLIEAINSENHWELAKPLFERVQEHFKRPSYKDPESVNSLFEINLLLHYKAKNFAALRELPLPTYSHGDLLGNRRIAQNKQLYYIGLYKLYHDQAYDEAVEIFQALLTQDDQHVPYAYHLLRAETLKALHQ
jgi:hypothetical protein